LLEHPLTAEWFEEEKQCALLAFKRIPMPARMEEYLSAQAYVHAVERLEGSLRQLYERYLRQEEEQAQEEQARDTQRQGWDFDPTAPY
jgi:hypothetical protein